jgi:hypothetical protein
MTALLLAAAALHLQAAASVQLQIRVFDGADEVTADTRIVLYHAGDRSAAVAQSLGRTGLDNTVEPGLYDAQAIRSRNGQVVSIQWAERLVVMPYPDERGRHLEVINFQAGFGALQVAAREDGEILQAALFAAGSRTAEAATAIPAPGYLLFVVPAGTYDLRVTRGGQTSWHTGIDVPRGRTRFWIEPPDR